LTNQNNRLKPFLKIKEKKVAGYKKIKGKIKEINKKLMK